MKYLIVLLLIMPNLSFAQTIDKIDAHTYTKIEVSKTIDITQKQLECDAIAAQAEAIQVRADACYAEIQTVSTATVGKPVDISAVATPVSVVPISN